MDAGRRPARRVKESAAGAGAAVEALPVGVGAAATVLRGGRVSGVCVAEMVEVDGMLVSASAAERRKFFSALLQRAAKRRRDQGGGALTFVLGVLGVPASGDKTAAAAAGSRAPKALDAYKHLSPELKAKMAAALAAKAEAGAAALVPQAGAPAHSCASAGLPHRPPGCQVHPG